MDFSLYDMISPLDFRYYGGNERAFKLLQPYLSEAARVRYEARTEAALAQAFVEAGLCKPEYAAEIAKAAEAVTPAEVAAEEARIKHNIRALVNCMRKRVSEAARPFLHLGATSFDIIDTATAARYKAAWENAVRPTLLDLLKTWLDLAERYADQVQIGRTHGQFAEPITFGFAVAGYVSRLGQAIERGDKASANLRGKLSGAVGASNALSLLVDDPWKLEQEFLAELGLKPSPTSTQIVEPEYVVDFLHAHTVILGIMADFADDMRHLQRSELAEVQEEFASEQVGSSTMPHKRNPWNFENVKSFWKAFTPRMLTVYQDQLCEHQRDLTNSASGRFSQEIIAAVVLAALRLKRISARLEVNAEAMERNFSEAARFISAEPAYILLAKAGHDDAHEVVRRLTLKAQAEGKSFPEVLAEESALAPYLAKLSEAERRLLSEPAQYTGLAAQKARAVCTEWRNKFQLD